MSVVACTACGAKNRVDDQRQGEGRCGKCREPLFSKHPAELTDATFSQVIASDVPTLVDFWAPWCGPCRQMAPAFEQAAAQLHPRMRLAKLNTQAYERLGGELGIHGIPTMIVYRQGREIGRTSGARPAEAIVSWARGVAGV